VTFLAPWFLAGGAAAAAAMVAVHLLAFDRPPESPLPTARFVPPQTHRSASWARAPRDRLLLLLRVSALLLLGAAFARPVSAPTRAGRVAVVVVDRSRAARATPDPPAVLGGARAVAVIAFDSVARTLPADALDSVLAAPPGATGGLISAGLVAAVGAATAARATHDSVEIVLVSPVTADAIDAATARVRAAWGGPIRVVRTAAAPAARPRVAVRAPDGDPVRVAVARGGALAGDAAVRVVRDSVTVADLAFARDGGAVADWTLRGDSGAVVTALVAGGLAAVGRFTRGDAGADGRAVAWWADGAVAARERPMGSGCVRRVAAGLPEGSDLGDDPGFIAVVAMLGAPCGGAVGPPVSDSVVATLVGPAGAAVPGVPPSPWARWLLTLAMALLVAELAVRRRGA
jgi:hypothetical protein